MLDADKRDADSKETSEKNESGAVSRAVPTGGMAGGEPLPEEMAAAQGQNTQSTCAEGADTRDATNGPEPGEEPGVVATAPDVDSGDLPTGSRGIPGMTAPEDVTDVEEVPEPPEQD